MKPPTESLGPVAPGVGGGVAKIAAVVALGLAVLTWALKRRDALVNSRQYSSSGRRCREGWTRGGSPGIFG